MYRLILVILVVSSLLCVVPNPVGASPAGAGDHPALELELRNLEGGSVRLSEFLGDRATVLLLWATWNGRSLEALRDGQRLVDRFGDQGLRVVSVNVDGEGGFEERRDRVVRVRKDLGLSYPMLIDRDLDVYAAYGVMAVPYIVVAREGGEIRQSFSGYSGFVRSEFQECVSAALEAGASTTDQVAMVSKDRLTKGEGSGPPEASTAWMENVDLTDSIRHLSRALAQNPFDPGVCRALAAALQRAGRWQEAQRISMQLEALAMR